MDNVKKFGKLDYKIKYNKEPKECKVCNISVRTDSFARHVKSKKHLRLQDLQNDIKKVDDVVPKKKEKIIKLKDVKVVVKPKKKIDKSKYESFKSRYARDPEFKKRHLENVLQKIQCEDCGRTYMKCHRARHKRSKICKRLSEEIKQKQNV